MLLNLDSEEDGELTIGCAGSEDHLLMLTAPREPLPPGAAALAVTVRGGRGGHSGADIAAGRANAVKLLAHALRGAGDVRIAAFDGGASRNAIPRDAAALVVGEGVRAAVEEAGAAARRTYRRTDPGVRMDVEPAAAAAAWTAGASARLLDLLALLPVGPLAMSADFAGLVETSSSVGVAGTDGDRVTIRCLSRSQDDDALPVVRAQIEAAARLAGATHESLGSYPAWRPDPGSALLASARGTYAATFGAEPQVSATHGGLETALIGAKRPGLPMLSFGPQIQGPHAPGERLHIPSAGPLHAAVARAARRAVALTKARKTSSWRASSFQLSCSSHCTPSTHASPASSIASTTPSSARPVASRPSPSRSIAWWCQEFTRCGPGPSAAASREPGVTCSSWSGWPGMLAPREHRLAHQRPAVPVPARVLAGVGVHRAAARDVEHLHAAADPEHGLAGGERGPGQARARTRRGALGDVGERRVRGVAAVARRVDVAAEAHEDPVRERDGVRRSPPGTAGAAAARPPPRAAARSTAPCSPRTPGSRP